MSHSPLPWEVIQHSVDRLGLVELWIVPQGTEDIIAKIDTCGMTSDDMKEINANAELLVRAVNHHANLIETLKMAIFYWDANLPEMVGETERDDLAAARADLAAAIGVSS